MRPPTPFCLARGLEGMENKPGLLQPPQNLNPTQTPINGVLGQFNMTQRSVAVNTRSRSVLSNTSSDRARSRRPINTTDSD